MHDHACRLVDDNHVGVLIDDVQVERFGLRRGADRLGYVDVNHVAAMHEPVGSDGLPSDLHLALFDEPLDLRSRLPGQHAGQIAIDADARIFAGNGEREKGPGSFFDMIPEK